MRDAVHIAAVDGPSPPTSLSDNDPTVFFTPRNNGSSIGMSGRLKWVTLGDLGEIRGTDSRAPSRSPTATHDCPCYIGKPTEKLRSANLNKMLMTCLDRNHSLLNITEITINPRLLQGKRIFAIPHHRKKWKNFPQKKVSQNPSKCTDVVFRLNAPQN